MARTPAVHHRVPRILFGDGLGGFKAAEGSAFRAEPGSYRFAMGDLNGDGRLDIVASSFGANALTLLYGR